MTCAALKSSISCASLMLPVADPLQQRANTHEPGERRQPMMTPKETDYVFTGETNRQIPGSLFRRSARWKETAPANRSIHDLRHYAASMWLRAGIPVNQVSQWLGHANPNTTPEIYAHVLGADQDSVARRRLNDIEAGQATRWPAGPELLPRDGPSL